MENSSGIFGAPQEPFFNHKDCGICREVLTEWLLDLNQKNSQLLKSNSRNKDDFKSSTHVDLIYKACEKMKMSSQVKLLAVEIFNRFMLKHVGELYSHVTSSGSRNKRSDWLKIIERISKQQALRITSCCQIASKLTSHYKRVHHLDVPEVPTKVRKQMTKPRPSKIPILQSTTSSTSPPPSSVRVSTKSTSVKSKLTSAKPRPKPTKSKPASVIPTATSTSNTPAATSTRSPSTLSAGPMPPSNQIPTALGLLKIKMITASKSRRFLRELGHHYTADSILQSELRVLKTLDFKLGVVSPLLYVDTLLEIIGYNARDTDVKLYHSTAIKILLLFNLKRSEIRKKLIVYNQVNETIQKSPVARVNQMLNDMMMLGAAVITASVFIMSRPDTDTIVEHLALITKIQSDNIIDFATVLIEIVQEGSEKESST